MSDKNIVFKAGKYDVKYRLDYSDYGFTLTACTKAGEVVVACIGDSEKNCVYMIKPSAQSLPVAVYCRPYRKKDALTYPSKRWAEIARGLQMFKQTPNGRTLIAKPIVDEDHVCGVRILCADSRYQEALDVVELWAGVNKKGTPVFWDSIAAHIVNPD